VKNAFLHGDLKEEVYMELPPGFDNEQVAGKVCWLKRSLYGLKQFPRAWFDRFSKVVIKEGYLQSNADHTMFIRKNWRKLCVLIVYVDDIVLTGNDTMEMGRIKDSLATKFEMKDLDALRYFLGIEVVSSSNGVFLSQQKYVLELLHEVGMLGCRPTNTPIDPNHGLKGVSDQVDWERYQRLVGRLIYLSHTRPDISCAVSVVSCYMHDPRVVHQKAVYRILRYLKGCPGRGLLFEKKGHMRVEVYTDADWAGCQDDKRSTSGHCAFVGGNLVSWRSKKTERGGEVNCGS
jgi:Reverse transcriptase (RNA-dependent DNA polymerase)